VLFESVQREPAFGSKKFLPVESYVNRRGRIERLVTRRDGTCATSSIRPADSTAAQHDPFSEFWRSWLLGSESSVALTNTARAVTVADLFSGCGGLSVGIREACGALGYSERIVLAVDTNERAMDVFADNFRPERQHRGPIGDLVDGELGARLTAQERRLSQDLEGLTIAVGGPPCQGHSDLNNHTRRIDPKNALYLRMARFVEVVRPKSVIIENVPGVRHDRTNVVGKTRDALRAAGYFVSDGILAADRLGWAQKRKRHVMLASLEVEDIDVGDIEAMFETTGRPMEWAISQIEESDEMFDTAAKHSSVNKGRIDYLFDHNLYDLPDEQRPDCHRLKPHSYTSVYGRMRPNQPAPTITSGFGSTGQGRFVHPFERRTLTPHEAARLQGFPDSFTFEHAGGRRALQEMIGNAVPSRLAFVAAIALLR
jgi:DNA (cytosine-5)-methyltransferase 1